MKNLKSAKILSKTEQQSINGGFRMCNNGKCGKGYCCYGRTCYPEYFAVCGF